MSYRELTYISTLENKVNSLQLSNEWMSNRIAEYQKEVDSLKADNNKWRQNYYEILDELNRRG